MQRSLRGWLRLFIMMLCGVACLLGTGQAQVGTSQTEEIIGASILKFGVLAPNETKEKEKEIEGYRTPGSKYFTFEDFKFIGETDRITHRNGAGESTWFGLQYKIEGRPKNKDIEITIRRTSHYKRAATGNTEYRTSAHNRTARIGTVHTTAVNLHDRTKEQEEEDLRNKNWLITSGKVTIELIYEDRVLATQVFDLQIL